MAPNEHGLALIRDPNWVIIKNSVVAGGRVNKVCGQQLCLLPAGGSSRQLRFGLMFSSLFNRTCHRNTFSAHVCLRDSHQPADGSRALSTAQSTPLQRRKRLRHRSEAARRGAEAGAAAAVREAATAAERRVGPRAVPRAGDGAPRPGGRPGTRAEAALARRGGDAGGPGGGAGAGEGEEEEREKGKEESRAGPPLPSPAPLEAETSRVAQPSPSASPTPKWATMTDESSDVPRELMGVSSERVAHPVLGVSNTLPKQEANAGGSKGGKVVWHCPGTQRSGSLDSRGKVDESIKDVIGRKIKISVKKKVKLEVKGDRVENKVLFTPSSAQWFVCVLDWLNRQEPSPERSANACSFSAFKTERHQTHELTFDRQGAEVPSPACGASPKNECLLPQSPVLMPHSPLLFGTFCFCDCFRCIGVFAKQDFDRKIPALLKNRKFPQTEGENEAVVSGAMGSLSRTAADAGTRMTHPIECISTSKGGLSVHCFHGLDHCNKLTKPSC
ncbi:hypothetical protein ACRRTK_018240 [Alexandromys fortis]